MSTRPFLVVVLTIITVGAILGGLSGRLRDIDPQTVAAIDLQPVTERVWRAQPDRLVWRLDAEDLRVKGSILLEVDEAGCLLVVDFDDMIVRKFSPQGQLLQRFGDPDSGIAFASVTDIEETDSGELWVADNSSRRVFVFDSAGELQRMIELAAWPYRIVVFPGGSFVIMHPMESDSLFGRFNRDGQPAESFGRWIADQQTLGLALDGWLASDRHGGFVYGALYGGFLAAYEGNGRQRFAVRTIDGRSLPSLESRESGGIMIDPEAQTSILSLSVSGDEIHVLGAVQQGLRRLGTIDTYDLSSGRYKFSRRVPEGCRRVVVTETLIYTVGERSIAAWQRPSGA